MSVVKGCLPVYPVPIGPGDLADNKMSLRPIRHFVAIRTLGGGRCMGLSAVRSGNAKTLQNRGLPLGIFCSDGAEGQLFDLNPLPA